jgi:phosphoribosyl 1,2-cyclic phosphodiesterase
MRAAGVDPASVSALVLTHAHGDHATGARVAARRFGWTVYATPGTIRSLPDLAEASPVPISPRESLYLDTMVVTSVPTPHDCAEPVALALESRSSGARCGVAWDMGHVPASVERAMGRLDAIVLESNHDEQMLRSGPYPRSVQHRIAGGQGHLSNRAAARLARAIAHRGLRHVVLAHLSEQNNTAEVARATMHAALRTSAFRGSLSVAPQDAITQFTVERSRHVEQMNLFQVRGD